MVISLAIAGCSEEASDCTDENNSNEQYGKADSPTTLTEVAATGYISLEHNGKAYVDSSQDLFEGRKVNVTYTTRRAISVLSDANCDVILNHKNNDLDKYSYGVLTREFDDNYSMAMTTFIEFRSDDGILDYKSISGQGGAYHSYYIFGENVIPEGTTKVAVYSFLQVIKTNPDAAEPGSSCSVWDSNFGQNFVYQVSPGGAPSGTILFNSDWTQPVQGSLKAGKVFKILYNKDRLKSILEKSWTSKYGCAIPPSIFVNLRIDNGPYMRTVVGAYSVNQCGGDERVWTDFDPVIMIPTGAKYVEMYFEVVGYMGTTGYDSNYGANYFFDVN